MPVASSDQRPVGVLCLLAKAPTAAVVTTGSLTSVKEQATGAYRKPHPGSGCRPCSSTPSTHSPHPLAPWSATFR
jgi:hypothetical protein